MSPKYNLDITDLKHVAMHSLMAFIAAAPAVVYVHGSLDLKAVEGLLVSCVLFAGQSFAQRWLADNQLPQQKQP